MSSPTPPKENAVGAGYGPSKTGKTTDLLYSFPRGLFIALPGALKSAAMVGWLPDWVPAKTIKECTAVVRKESKTGKYDAAVIDDITLVVDNTVAFYESKAGGGLTGWVLYGKITDDVLELLEEARKAGMHVWFCGHEQPQTMKEGKIIRGSIKLPGQLPEKFPGMLDTILRVKSEPSKSGWPAIYYCGGPRDPLWITGDRHGVCGVSTPMNTAEILRAAGYVIRRAPGLEWMDGAVAAVTDAVMELAPAGGNRFFEEVQRDELVILQAAADRIRAKYTQDTRHVVWALRDIVDRVALRRGKGNNLLSFGVT